MDNQDDKGDQVKIFYERYFANTDSEILKILRNHKDYQEAAVNAAVKIAVERNLIHSEQDLLAPEFQKSQTSKFTIFPVPNNNYHQKRLIGSISRFLYLLSLLPVIFGAMSYAEGKLDLALEATVLGVIWAVLSFLYRKRRNNFLLLLLFLILSGIFVFTVVRLINQETLNIMDLSITIIGVLISTYLLFYLKKLLLIRSDEE